MNSAEFRPEDLDRVTAQAEEMLLRVEEIRKEIDVVVGRGTGADGQIQVAAGANGRLTEVVIAPRAMRLDSTRLAAEILLAAQLAQNDVDSRVKEVMAETLGQAMPTQDLLEDGFTRVLESFESSMDEQLQAIDDRRRQIP
ncbi:YbaB/EbfC family nucleoid-associated protein [Nonomuraea rhizosphaerae]|uniref:YbaB/EbfC family nucleoid-associated protein n=1 Tax=Nonomuraea rhizosphaerae TaxID=2665663 RepID=UPI001C5DC739|nr:YbaB/EbfC family nucleoid-associated protein [Nonomuraea rhizosphaerae]